MFFSYFGSLRKKESKTINRGFKAADCLIERVFLPMNWRLFCFSLMLLKLTCIIQLQPYTTEIQYGWLQVQYRTTCASCWNQMFALPLLSAQTFTSYISEFARFIDFDVEVNALLNSFGSSKASGVCLFANLRPKSHITRIAFMSMGIREGPYYVLNEYSITLYCIKWQGNAWRWMNGCLRFYKYS